MPSARRTVSNKRKRESEPSGLGFSEKDIELAWAALDTQLWENDADSYVDSRLLNGTACVNCGSLILATQHTDDAGTCTDCSVVLFQPVGLLTDSEIYENFVVVDPHYKPVSYFNTVCAQAKGEGGNVPEDVVDTVRQCYLDDKIPLKNARAYLTKKYLRKLHMADKDSKYWCAYYKHTIQITAMISGGNIAWLNPENESILLQHWKESQVAWANCPDWLLRSNMKTKRSSFVNYLNFIKRITQYLAWQTGDLDFQRTSQSIPPMKTPETNNDLNNIWTYFGIYNAWKGFEKGLMLVDNNNPENIPQLNLGLLKRLKCSPRLLLEQTRLTLKYGL